MSSGPQAGPSATAQSSTESEEEVALRALVPAAEDFQNNLRTMIRDRKTFTLRIEIRGSGGKISDMDNALYVKRKPSRPGKRKPDKC